MVGENPNGLGLIPLTVWRGGNLTGSIKNCPKPVPNFLIIFLDRFPQRNREIWPKIWAEKALINLYILSCNLKVCAPLTLKLTASLEALHPQSFPPPFTPWQDLFLGPEIVPELLARSLRAFPAETAPGLTDALLSQVAAVVSLVSQGMAPTTIVGQLLYHLVVASVQGEARHYFWPLQVGIEVNGGKRKLSIRIEPECRGIAPRPRRFW